MNEVYGFKIRVLKIQKYKEKVDTIHMNVFISFSEI